MDVRSLWALLLLLGFCSAQEVSVCVRALVRSCGECLRVSEQCAWCADESFQSLRCNDLQSLTNQNCRTIENPRGSISVEKNLPLSETRNLREEEIVQIQPQEISLSLRIGEPQTLFLKFKRAEDYPIDLYYLMDLSSSMKDDLENIKNLGTELMKEMQQITSDFRIGLGVISRTDATVPSPCSSSSSQDCPGPFVFKNLLKLSSSGEEFDRLVAQQQISENMEAPEGGYNTILQVALCEEQIGWRDSAVRLLVVSTDGIFHTNGDQKFLAQGGRCEMENDTYTNTGPESGRPPLTSSDTDGASSQKTKPTVFHLARKLYQHNIQTVFAVTENMLPVYQELQDRLPKSTVGTLSSNSSNIVELILEAYRTLSSKVVLDNTQLPEGVFASFKSVCKNGAEGLGEVGGRTCSNISISDEVLFEVSVTARKCPEQGKPEVIKFRPLGFSEGAEVKLNFLCECQCSTKAILQSDMCSRAGTMQCGVCRCDPGRVGDRCECDVDDLRWSADGDAGCRPTPHSDICNNNGECVCGTCECKRRENPEERYSGQFCECDNFNCDRSGNKLCGGHGRCECRMCICEPGYTGSACDCSLDLTSCLAKSGEICNGHGICECGACRCTNPKFMGRTCEICPTCPGVCTKLKSCVQCRVWGTGEKAQSCESDCSDFTLTTVKNVGALPQPSDTYHVVHCKERDEDDCWFYYTYSLRHGIKEVHAAQNMDCPSMSLLDHLG